jgi:hypothetical protein
MMTKYSGKSSAGNRELVTSTPADSPAGAFSLELSETDGINEANE